MESALSKARSLAARTIHIKISPTPQNFSESRVVLQELEQKFGEVIMFRSLKHHPTAPVQNAVTAIFHSESAAKAALEKTNHRYGLVIEPAPPISSFVGPPIPPLESELTPEETAESKAQETQEVKEFQLDIWPSNFVHEKYIKSPLTNPLYGPFKPIKPENSFIGGVLKQSLPPSLWAKGLMDWETDAARRNMGATGLEADLEGAEKAEGGDGQPINAASAFQWRHRRRRVDALPTVMKGLKVLEEERQRRDKEAEH